MKKTKIVKIEEDAHQAAKIEAAKEGTTLQVWISNVIRRLTKPGEKSKNS